MESSTFLFQAFIYLGAAVVSVPIAKRLGLGSVLGYLLAGVIITTLELSRSEREVAYEVQHGLSLKKEDLIE